MFTNNRTDKEITRNEYEIISIGTNNGHNATGASFGKKKLRNVIRAHEQLQC